MVKLKTLKDLKEKEIKAICKNLKVKSDTLCNFGKLGLMTVEELVEGFYNSKKAEAIKWVKEHIKERRKLNVQIGDALHKRKDSGVIARNNELINLNFWIKNFFNITEEDLNHSQQEKSK